jgi:hypothetical protein
MENKEKMTKYDISEAGMKQISKVNKISYT